MSSVFSLSISDLPLGKFDLGGVLYHANYYYLYERAREAFLATHQLPYSSLVSQGRHLAVVESHQKFFAPIYYGQPIIIQLTTSELKRTTVIFNYQLFSIENPDKPLHTAWTRHAMVINDNGFSVAALTESLKQAFISIHG